MRQVEFWSLKRVIEVTGVSKSEIYRRMKLNQFPKSHSYKDGEKRRFWISTEIMTWQQAQVDYRVRELHPAASQNEFDDLL